MGVELTPKAILKKKYFNRHFKTVSYIVYLFYK